MTHRKIFDVLIIGGSYAGLSAAMALGRSLKNVLVIDSGKPCNATTPHSHNFLTQDGIPPKEIAAIAQGQVKKYETVRFYSGLAVSGTKTGDEFQITTQTGDTFWGKKVVFATGIKDEMLPIQGLVDCWGKSVIHCPYCHGYEYRHKKTGILANGESAFHMAKLVNNLTDELTLLTNGPSNLSSEQTEALQKYKIPIIETGVTNLEHEKGCLQQVVFKDGSSISLDAMYASLPFVQHSEIPVSLGCELTEQGYIQTDPFQKTTVPGVFACGDNASMMRSVANAVASGNIAGAMANHELTEEQF
ncbi:NAD(P)/FAD-dependent oxidoreductase [Rapidithrix thailandica]|uniref:NAD(P)/FAD-dependent oxidoreductase n=1 Tax=Rapidithrix thailandica TaxID=413964 RepID=A0AAW9SG76_9BACT